MEKSGMTGQRHHSSISSEFFDENHNIRIHNNNNNLIHYSESFPTVPVNGIWHRAPTGTSQYIFHGYNYDATNYDTYSCDLSEMDEINIENFPTDPFLVTVGPDRFRPCPFENEEQLDPRIQRVPFSSLTNEDFEFLSSATKRLIPLVNYVPFQEIHEITPEIITIQHPNHHKSSTTRQPRHHPAPKIHKIGTMKNSGRKKLQNQPLKQFRGKSMQAPLRIAADLIHRVNQTAEFVGFCGSLKVNPFFSDCMGRVSATKDDIGNCFFLCANCGTRRRYLPENK
uniref:Uncharacterized protein n=2 Tax=Panagrolaimus sp. JU765 TaxID=591449 RepID=A0AC34QVA9_9BILA